MQGIVVGKPEQAVVTYKTTKKRRYAELEFQRTHTLCALTMQF